MVVRIGPGVDPGWVVAGVGVALDVVGWYQISGQPTEAQQLPYLASATIPGAALIVAGAVLLAARRRVRDPGTRGTFATAGNPRRRTGLWALPDGSYVHRGDCPLLDGKPDAFELTATGDGTAPATAVEHPPTRLCPVCEPDVVAAT
ncbi:MAG: hypothetical protein ACRDVE_18220 [Actinocrinis sp.]